MERFTNIKIIILTLGIFLALSSILTTNLNSNVGISDKNSEYSDDTNLDNENLKTSKISGPIYINDNNPSNNWSIAKDAGICTGNGTYSEPYVIEDLVIDGGGSGDCIWIKNSNVHFRIENCTVYNSWFKNAGIRLSHVNNGQLINNNCSSYLFRWNYDGINLEYSNNNNISGNNVNGNPFGISLWGNGNIISGNNINFNDFGIVIAGSYNTISGNSLDCIYSGIYLANGDYNNISGNTANYNEYGIYLGNCDYNIVSGNTANYNECGIWLNVDCDNNTISGNTANFNFQFGIHLQESDYNNITANIVNYNDVGIYLANGDYNIVSGNTANYNEYGISLSHSDNNSILVNNVSCHYYRGITLSWSDNNNIIGNTINNNSVGIYLYNSHSNEITSNSFSGNDVDIQKVVDKEPPFPPEIINIILILIVITMIITGMIIINKKLFTDRVEDHPPMLGITAFIFDLIGLILIVILFRPDVVIYLAFRPGVVNILYATPFTITGIICGYAGYKFERDNNPRLAKVGTIFGIILFFISIWPILRIIFYIGAGGW